MDDDFIRTITRAQVLIIHTSGQNSPYDMKTEVLTHVNVQWKTTIQEKSMNAFFKKADSYGENGSAGKCIWKMEGDQKIGFQLKSRLILMHMKDFFYEAKNSYIQTIFPKPHEIKPYADVERIHWNTG